MKYIMMIVLLLSMNACTNHTLKAPCPDFGKYCRKIPINAWNYHHAALL
jgi:hypothetical protein